MISEQAKKEVFESSLNVMAVQLESMLKLVNEGRRDLKDGSLNQAMGAVINFDRQAEKIERLYHAMVAVHIN